MDSKILSSENVHSTKKVSTSKIKSSESKTEGLSLFDSILAKNKNNSSEVKVKKDTVQIPKKEIGTVKVTDKEKSSTTKTKMSLLDSMIKDIKIDSNKEKSLISSSKTVENKENTKEQLILKSDDKKSDTKSVLKNNKVELKELQSTIKISSKIESKESSLRKNESKIDIKKNLEDSIKNDKKTMQNNISTKHEIKNNIKVVKTDTIVKNDNKTADLKQSTIKDTEENNGIILNKLQEDTNTKENVEILTEDLLENKKIQIRKDDSNNETSTNNKLDNKVVKGSLLESLLKTTNSNIKIKKDENSDKSTNKNSKIGIKDQKENDMPLQAKIFLSNQQTQKKIISKQKLNEVKEIIKKEPKTAKNLEKSANTLELNASKSELIKEDITDKKDIDLKTTKTKENLKEQMNEQNNMLNKMFLNKTKDHESISLLKELDTKHIQKNDETKAKKTEEVIKQKDVEIVVEQTVAQNMVTKIVESKQKMNSFMSDVARNMYLNYKPPVTSFKINLNPLNLGNIAITMKSNKATNSISVSLNMSQNSTLETFNDNKNVLQNVLNKIFTSDTSFNLNFSMQGDDSNNNFEQFKEEQKNQNTQNHSIDTNDEIEQKEEIEQEKSYM